MIDNIIKLYKNTKYQDEFGVWRQTATPRIVFCQVSSVSQSEFFEGGRNGLNPAYRFTVFQGDYENEIICKYNGLKYAIYRTYIVPGTDYIELYAERQGGANGTQNNTGSISTDAGQNT